MRSAFRLAVAMTLFAAPHLAGAAQVYKCVDPKTKAVTYGNAPCATGDQTKINTVDNAVMDGRSAQRELERQQAADSQEMSRAVQQQRATNALQDAAAASAISDERVQREKLANECSRGFKNSCAALKSLDRGSSADAGAPSGSAGASQKVDPYYTEKRLTHGRSGWDMKTQNQIDLETTERTEKARAAAVTNPMVTNCDSAGCWGTDGTRYNRGAGSTLFGSNGKTCQWVSQGAPLQCN